MGAVSRAEREQAITLGILSEIAEREDVTQRHLADRLDVALGLANSYLKRCLRKGYIKIAQAPANRYLYYLTPKGFAEKGRLTAQYLAYSFDFYRRASADVVRIAERCRAAGVSRVMFAGVSELAEIGSIRLFDARLQLVGTFDPASDLKCFLGRPVWHRLVEVETPDAVIFTALREDVSMHDVLAGHFGTDRVHVPEIVMPLATRRGARVRSRTA